VNIPVYTVRYTAMRLDFTDKEVERELAYLQSCGHFPIFHREDGVWIFETFEKDFKETKDANLY
jgi:hypothetical protein